MVGGKGVQEDEDIQVEDEDPFLLVQRDLAKGLQNIR